MFDERVNLLPRIHWREETVAISVDSPFGMGIILRRKQDARLPNSIQHFVLAIDCLFG